MYYKLDDDNKAIPCDLHEWGQMYQTKEGQEKRHVALDDIGEMQISTVFLGLDHNHYGGRPLLFETMIFNGPGDGYQSRCTTWEEAQEMHKTAIQWIKDGCKDE